NHVEILGGGGGGAGGASGSGASVSNGIGSTGSGNAVGCTGACCPTDPACTAVKSQCIALADNTNQSTFALRIAQLDLTKPPGFTNPLLKGVIATGVEMNLDKCNLGGGGSFNVIMQFDKAAMTLKMGGAHPAMDPIKGYTFGNEADMRVMVAPVTMPVTIDAAGNFTQTKGVDLVLPIYLAVADPIPSVLWPLHKVTIAGKLSADHDCIGK